MGRKYNILYTSSFSSLKGGGQRSTYLLIKYLDKEKFTPFLALPEEGEFSREMQKLKVKTFIISFSRIKSLNVISIIRDFCRLWTVIKGMDIDIIHTESPRQTIYAGIIGKILKVPVIMHLRVSESSPWLDWMLYRTTDRMIAVSQCVSKRFNFIDAGDRVKVIYNGVELDTFTPSDRYGEDEFLKVGYFGRIERRKGIEILIGAVRKVREKINLTIMGDGDRQYLEELKALCGGANVIFKDYKKDIIDEIRGGDVTVLPSLKGEGLSRIIIESMAMGKTVIISDLYSNREALGDDFEEFIFPPGDVSGLAAIIEKILDNRQILYENKSILRKRAEEFFDIRKNTLEIEKLYDSVLKDE
ncbi:MAG: glycosyltransferase family 4 protein [Candidatus Omnitrophica bacterium]|nr:glycosyltransferase family 4 protein [Candidatus Omnitrophota bacterium]